MSTYKSIKDVLNEIENWLRVATLLHSGIEQALLSILHNEVKHPTYNGLPKDPIQLYIELNTTHKRTLTQLKSKKVLSKEQMCKLLPNNGQTYSAELDTTLIVILIINCTNLPPPVTGWNYNNLQPTDQSKAAYVLRAREWRNYIHHTDPRDIDGVTFVQKWREGENIIVGLGYKFDSKTLKSISLDPKTSTQQHLILKALNYFCHATVKDHDQRLTDIKQILTQNTDAIKKNEDRTDKNTDGIKKIEDRTDKNTDAIKEIEDRTDKNTDAIKKIEDRTDKNTEGIKKIGDRTDKNTDGIKKIENRTDKNTDGIKKIEDRTDKNTDAIKEIEDRTDKNTDGIKKIGDRTDKNTDAIKKIENRTDKNTDGIKKIEDRTDKNTDGIKKIEDRTDKNTDAIKKIENRTDKNTDTIKKNENLLQGLAIEVKAIKIEVNKKFNDTGAGREGICAPDPRVAVVTHFGNGCVLKFETSSTDQIESVKYKSIAPEQDCDWTEIPRKTEENTETVCFKENTEEGHLVFIKIENLMKTRRYQIFIHTVEDHYNTDVTIYDKDKCGHVIRADKHFIVLAPPSGRLKDENCCKIGIKGKFVEKEMTLNVPISQGPIDENMKVSEFTDFSNTYRKRNFPTTEDVIEFPPFSCIKDPDVKETAEMFSKFLSTRKGLRAVVWNADSNNYIECVFQSEISLKPELKFDNRVVVYDDSTASILNIRVIQQSGNMFNEMENTVTDLQSFVATHRHSNSSLYCLGILCFPNANRREVESQMNLYFSTKEIQYAKLFYVCKEDLECLNNWWENVFEKELDRLESICQCKTNRMEQNNSFGDVLSECLATIAMANTSTTPTLTEDTHLQIKTLLLNADQIEAIEHPAKKKLIQGNYGSGKSIVADEIFKKIYKQHRFDRRKLLNVVWESYSLLEVHKDNLLREMQSIYPECSDEFHVSIGTSNNLNEGKDTSLLDFLTKALKGDKIVDIIIDELPSEAIHESEVETLRKLLDSYPKSSVILIPQSVIIDRNKNNEGGQTISIGRNCLHKIGLQEFTLSKTMRNTKQICAVLKLLQQEDIESVLTINETRIEQAASRRVNRKTIRQKIRTFFRMKKTTTTTTPTTTIETAVSRFTRSTIDISTEPPKPYFDKTAKYLHNSERKSSATSTQLVSSYHFHETTVGNTVEKCKPVLVNLSSILDARSLISLQILAITLEEVCHLLKSPQTLIICSTLEEIKLVSFSLSLVSGCLYEVYIPYLRRYIPTVKEKRLVMSKFDKRTIDDKRIILMDNTGAKGIEARNVVIFIQEHERFLRHEFIETLARANISCYIMMYTSPDAPDHQEGDIAHMMSTLVKKGLIVEKKVTREEDYGNFDKSHRFHGNNFVVNDAYCEDHQPETSINEFYETFDNNFPVKSQEPNYRKNLEEFTRTPMRNQIIHKVEYEGKTYTPRNVYQMLDDKDFSSFKSIIIDVDQNRINNLRTDGLDWTFLMWAILDDRDDICEYLTSTFTEQIDYTAKNVHGDTAFHYAAFNNNIDAMNILIANDRRGLEVRNDDGETPLFYAALHNHKSMVEFLLQHGVDPHVKNFLGRTADQQRGVVNEDVQTIIQNYQTKNASTGTS